MININMKQNRISFSLSEFGLFMLWLSLPCLSIYNLLNPYFSDSIDHFYNNLDSFLYVLFMIPVIGLGWLFWLSQIVAIEILSRFGSALEISKKRQETIGIIIFAVYYIILSVGLGSNAL